MEKHHHSRTISDGIVKPHLLATTLVCLKVADSVQDELLLLLGKNHLFNDEEKRGNEGGREGGRERERVERLKN